MFNLLVIFVIKFREDYEEHRCLPKHCCFVLVCNCEQILSKVLSRRLLTFEKVKEPKVIFVIFFYINIVFHYAVDFFLVFVYTLCLIFVTSFLIDLPSSLL